jgi:hypothetical protein
MSDGHEGVRQFSQAISQGIVEHAGLADNANC